MSSDTVTEEEVLALTALLNALGLEDWESVEVRGRVLRTLRSLASVQRAQHRRRYDAERKRRRTTESS